MISITLRQRRDLTTRRHHLAGDAASPEQTARSLVALHATDPATIFLSVLARCAGSSLDDIHASLYRERSLVRWMAMRRTLFVLPRESVAMVQAAASAGVASTMRKHLIKQLEISGTEPVIAGDVANWLDDVEAGVHRALLRRGTAAAPQLSADEPRLRTSILPRAGADVPQNLTSRLLVLMGTEAKIVRGAPTGGWISRRHQWEPVDTWWPGGLPVLETAAARTELVRAWLTAFGPAPVADLEWWTGWTKTAVRAALAALPVREIDLHGTSAVMLADEELDLSAVEPVVTLLPSLDATPMGWKQRDWFFGIEQAEVFDRNGNIGPTVWWDGQVIGGWAIGPDGSVRTAVLADRGRDVAELVDREAAVLEGRLGGARVIPSFRTPLEKTLAT